ncbi:MAG: heavy-metal-associated domain-containing protein [Solirubrobacteraceae bacterium]
MSRLSEKTYIVEGMTCGHCELSVREEVEELAGVNWVHADRTTGRLTVRGEDIEDAAVRGAGRAAGYDVARASAVVPGRDDEPQTSG